MLKYSVYYPFDAAARFDFDYYRNTHFPLVLRLLAAYGVRGFEIDRGVPGPDGTPPRYLAVGHILCDDAGKLAAGLEAHGTEIRGDVANYTDVTPFTQLNAVA